MLWYHHLSIFYCYMKILHVATSLSSFFAFFFRFVLKKTMASSNLESVWRGYRLGRHTKVMRSNCYWGLKAQGKNRRGRCQINDGKALTFSDLSVNDPVIIEISMETDGFCNIFWWNVAESEVGTVPWMIHWHVEIPNRHVLGLTLFQPNDFLKFGVLHEFMVHN